MLGITVEVVHVVIVMPLIIAGIIYLTRGKSIRAKYVITAAFLSVLASQVALLSCPLTVLSGWLLSFKYPEYDPNANSLVHWLYAKSGSIVEMRWLIVAGLLAGAAWCIRISRIQKASETDLHEA